MHVLINAHVQGRELKNGVLYTVSCAMTLCLNRKLKVIDYGVRWVMRAEGTLCD